MPAVRAGKDGGHVLLGIDPTKENGHLWRRAPSNERARLQHTVACTAERRLTRTSGYTMVLESFLIPCESAPSKPSLGEAWPVPCRKKRLASNATGQDVGAPLLAAGIYFCKGDLG